MKEKLTELLEQVEDEESFLLFVKELMRDRVESANTERMNPSQGYIPEAGGWENTSIEHFLEGALNWAEDTNFGRRMAVPEFELKNVPEWRRIAAFLMAGKLYE